jgi:uncharacterized protein (DUF362 family)/Pyruvate/2-oxoacid:ferredoxin oxidoreductase delta subunit
MNDVKSKVVVLKCEDYENCHIYGKIKEGIDLLGGIEQFVHPGENILLKPNIITGRSPDSAATTHPAVFEAVIRILQNAGVNVTYGDSPGFDNPVAALKKSGLTEVAERYHIEMGDFQSRQIIQNENGVVAKEFYLCNGVLKADGIISLPKMKAHQMTRLTGAVKNQFGCILGAHKAAYHAKLPNASRFCKMLAELNMLLKPRLYIMDGILAMEGNGPSNGNPIKMNTILISADPVALDATFCRLVGINATYMATNPAAQEAGLGTYQQENIELLGDNIEELINTNFDCVRLPVKDKVFFKEFAFLENLVSRKPKVDKSKCKNCHICGNACPVGAITFDKNNYPKYNYSKCIKCFCCQEVCPHKAIHSTNPLFLKLLK